MNNLWLSAEQPRPRVVGHRGASAHAPENTLAAFRLAMQQGAAGVELDVWRCRSGEVVVIHDGNVARTTNGQGCVRKMDWAALHALDAGRGERIPLLQEVLDAVAERSPTVLVNIELKQMWRGARELVCAVAALLRDHPCRGRVLISSFSPVALMWAARMMPDVPRAILYDVATPRWLRWLQQWAVPHQAEHPSVHSITPMQVRALHQRGIQVNTWTVNSQAELRWALTCDVDGVIGDSPLQLLAWLQAVGR